MPENAANSDKASLESRRRSLQKEQSKTSPPSAPVLATAALLNHPSWPNKIFLFIKYPNLEFLHCSVGQMLIDWEFLSENSKVEVGQ